MKIAVCVKIVPEASSLRMDPGTFRLDRSGERRVNPPDVHAVAEAVRLRAPGGTGEVVLLSVGPAESADSLRLPLALGADRCVLVADTALTGSDLVATTRVLVAALEREGPDLILFGQQAVESNGAVLWAAVADRLRLPVVSRAIAIDVTESTVTVTCSSERGLDLVELPLPAIVSVSTAVTEPRVPTFRELKQAGAKPCETLSLRELGLSPDEVGSAGSRTDVLAIRVPPSRGERLTIVDDGVAATAIFEFLMARGLV